MQKTMIVIALLSVGCNSLFENPVAPTDTTGGSGTQVNTPGLPGTSGYRDEVIRLTNDARRRDQPCSSAVNSSVTKNSALHRAAQLHTEDQRRNGVGDDAHIGSDGSNFAERARREGYRGRPIGENFAAGHTSPRMVVQGWISSPGHCRNLMNPSANEIGIGFKESWWTMVLGRG